MSELAKPWFHKFVPVTETLTAYEIEFHGEEQLLTSYNKVFPRHMPANTQLVYCWLPPKKDEKTGQATGTHRLRFFLCPVGKNGPRADEITRLLDEGEIPKKVKAATPMEIPEVIQKITSTKVAEGIAARMNQTIPPEADIETVRILLAMAAQRSPKAAEVLKKLEEEAKPATVEQAA